MGDVAIALRTISAPVGEIAIIGATTGVWRICLPGEDASMALAAAMPGPSEGSLDPVLVAEQGASELGAYFAGERRDFTVPVDLGRGAGFRRRVLKAAASIPFGETASYREMAIAAGSPGAVRAAGTAMGANPVPLLVPCHRVIRSDGSAGLYGGGEELKCRLLEFEAAVAATG